MPWLYPSNFEASFFPAGFLVLLLWSLAWKGTALWQTARRGQKVWFILLLVLNTVGILEIVYLVFVAKLFASSAKSSKIAVKKPAAKTKRK